MSPSKAPALELPAAKVHAWRVSRQLLPAGARAASPEDVARELVGVQAQVSSAAALSIALRSKRGRVGATTTALSERRLVKSWAMRGTLHLFAADDYPTIVAPLRRKEMWRRPAWLRWFGVTEPQMEATIEAIGEILDDGRPRTRAELADDLTARHGAAIGDLARGSWGSLLGLATNRGYLCHAASYDGAVRVVHPKRWLPTWRDADPDVALRELVLRYLGAYGPASMTELRRWWGVASQKDLRPAIDDLGTQLTEVEVAGDRGWVRTEDLDAIESTRPPRSSVHLLGPFDPCIVGAGLRDQLIRAAHLKRVSRTAGWISPVVLVDGRVAGVWDSSRAGDRLKITVDAFEPFDRTRKVAVERAAARVASVQGATARVAYGEVFARDPNAAPTFTIGPRDA